MITSLSPYLLTIHFTRLISCLKEKKSQSSKGIDFSSYLINQEG